MVSLWPHVMPPSSGVAWCHSALCRGSAHCWVQNLHSKRSEWKKRGKKRKRGRKRKEKGVVQQRNFQQIACEIWRHLLGPHNKMESAGRMMLSSSKIPLLLLLFFRVTYLIFCTPSYQQQNAFPSVTRLHLSRLTGLKRMHLKAQGSFCMQWLCWSHCLL